MAAAAATSTTTKVFLTDLASSVNHVPSNYMRPISDCPNLSDVQPSDVSIPLIGQARQQDGFFQLNNLMVAFCFASSIAIALAPIEVHSQLHSSLLWLALAVLLGFTSFVHSEFIDSRFVITVRVLQNFGLFFTVTAFCMAISLRFPFYFKCSVWAVYSISFLPTFISRSFYLASSVNHVPSNYIRPISDSPNLSDVQPSDVSIPHIDLQGLHGPYHSSDIKQIGQACQQDGFFQVKNHGIPDGSDTIDQLHAPKLVAKHRNNDLNNLMVAFCFAASMAIALLPIEVHSQLHSSLLWLALAVQLGFTSFFLSIFIDSRFVVTVRVLQKFGQFFAVTAFYVAISLRFPFYFKCISLAVYFISFLTIFISNFFYPASSVNHVPSNYIRPITDSPNLSYLQPSDASIPLIDLQGLHGPDHSIVIKQIGQACQQDGFFQVKNHGIPETLISAIMNLAREFFRLPESERMKSYSDDPTKTTRLSTSLNVKTENVSNWRDFLRLHCYPLEDYVNEWPSNPPSFREDVAEYCTSVRGLVLRLLEAISESLGLERDCIEKALGKQGQHMSLNYYPPCPQPELTYGLPGHIDPNLITILLQDDVPGLQVLRNGKWIAVNPIPNTFIVNIGDQMQVLSNDQYKSVLHRAVVNCNKERISIQHSTVHQMML